MSTINDGSQPLVEEEKGYRLNTGKPKLSMVPGSLNEAVARVLEFGAKKYAKNNWKKGMPWTETLDSALRHLYKWSEGEDVDEESGLCHLSHAATNIAFLLEHIKTHPELDDR